MHWRHKVGTQGWRNRRGGGGGHERQGRSIGDMEGHTGGGHAPCIPTYVSHASLP